MSSLRSSLAMMCGATLACGSAASAAAVIHGFQERSRTLSVPPLRTASGKLAHVFSIPFRGNPAAVSKIAGLEMLTLAWTSDGGAIKIVLDGGTPFPSKVTAVEVIENAGADASEVIDPLKRPSAMPVRPGHRLISTFRVPGRNSYLAAWRNVRSRESSLILWDEGRRDSEPILVAMSSSRILGAAVQISAHNNAELTIVVWTGGRSAEDVVAGMYTWTSDRD